MTVSTHLMTAEELFNLPDDGKRYELIKGELLTMSPTGRKHGSTAAKLTILLGHHVLTHNLGTMYAAETGFRLERDPDTVLAPDIAFSRRERVDEISETYDGEIPDLVVEVLSPSDRKGKVEQKASIWLSLGVSVLWVISPRTKSVDIRLASGERILLTEQDELTVGDLIPGFQVRVSEIFS